MERRGLILLGLWLALLFVASCRKAPMPAPTLGSLSPEEQKAVDSAQAFLAQQGKEWGQPSKVEQMPGEIVPGLKGDGVYCMTYPTPADEVKLVGDRAVLVDIQTGRVQMMPRK